MFDNINIWSLLMKGVIFFLLSLVGVTCFAFFWTRTNDCSKDSDCKQITIGLIKAWQLENLDGQRIKEIAKRNNFSYDSKHLYGKIHPYEVNENLYFEQRGNVFIEKNSDYIKGSKDNKKYKDVYTTGYKGGVAFYVIENSLFEDVTSNTDAIVNKNFTGILFVISDLGQAVLDYEHRSVVLITSDYWDVKKRDKTVPWVNPDDGFLFRRGVKVLSPR